MKTNRSRLLFLVGAISWMTVQSGIAIGAQSTSEKPQIGKYYDMYEPSQRQRLRRESCGRIEDPIGPYCVKQCVKGYQMVAGSNPPRCRSIEPLPQGQMPGPVRKEVGIQPPLPGPREPRQRSDKSPG